MGRTFSATVPESQHLDHIHIRCHIIISFSFVLFKSIDVQYGEISRWFPFRLPNQRHESEYDVFGRNLLNTFKHDLHDRSSVYVFNHFLLSHVWHVVDHTVFGFFGSVTSDKCRYESLWLKRLIKKAGQCMFIRLQW